MTVVGYPFDVYIPLFDPVINLRQIIQAFHVPGHMVQANLAPLDGRSIFPHFR
jgi:hypothetical protein